MTVILDTTAYRANSQNGLHFAGLTRLCNHNLIRLRIPYVVELETISQKKEEATKLFTEAKNSLHGLARNPSLTCEESSRIQDFANHLNGLKKTVVSTMIDNTWNYWKDMANAVTLCMSAEQSENAILAYINGTPPVSHAKNKKDLPDSFIYQQIRNLAEDEEVTVVTNDSRLLGALDGLANVTVFKKLAELLDSDSVRELFIILTEHELKNDFSTVLEFLQSNSAYLISVAARLGSDIIVGVQLPFDDPSENPYEHTIRSHGDPVNIILDFKNLKYYGDGEFGLPFKFSCEVLIDFFIDKAEYWALEKDEQPGISEWNDHVYEAESEGVVSVTGTLKISAPLEIYQEFITGGNDTDITSFDIEIDSIGNVEEIS